MNINTLAKGLRKKGLTVEAVTLHNMNGSGVDSPALMVDHNYSGYYPSREAFNAHNIASNYANRHGFSAEPRGCYTATLIW